MIEKRTVDTATYNDLLLNDIESAIESLVQVKTALTTFRNFGNADGSTSLIVLGMLASVQSVLAEDVKSSAVSLRFLLNDEQTGRDIAKAVGVAPGTFLKWVELAEVPDYLLPEEAE